MLVHLVTSPVNPRDSGDSTMIVPHTNEVRSQVEDSKICVVMVGLPARGKSYIAQKGTADLEKGSL
jgi:hypothetical protein